MARTYSTPEETGRLGDDPGGLRLQQDTQQRYGNQFMQDQVKLQRNENSAIFLFAEPLLMPRPFLPLEPMFRPILRPLVEPMARPAPVPALDPLPPLTVPMDGIKPDVGADPSRDTTTEGESESPEESEGVESDLPRFDRPEIEAPSEMEPGRNDGQGRPKSTDDGPYPPPESKDPTPDQYIPPELAPPKAPPAPTFRPPPLWRPA